jgi:hypothetical protein
LDFDTCNGSLEKIELEWNVVKMTIHLILQSFIVKGGSHELPISIKVSLCEVLRSVDNSINICLEGNLSMKKRLSLKIEFNFFEDQE